LEQGSKLILIDKDQSRLEQLIENLSAKESRDLSAYSCDLENAEERRKVFRTICQNNSLIHGIVNCAAFVGGTSLEGWSENFEEQSMDTWRRALEVNLTSVFDLVQTLIPSLRNAESASIVNISSIYGDKGPKWRIYENTSMGNPAAYAVSKGGVNQLTRWLATTLAPKIRVNAIVAGGIERNQPNSFKEKYILDVPLGRMAYEIDIVGPIMFLLSDLSSYVTGELLRVDGGRSIW
jgi:NAD(P)-dependent dehydrogenase (short-subunit alcohol dehydrogenase family)